MSKKFKAFKFTFFLSYSIYKILFDIPILYVLGLGLGLTLSVPTVYIVEITSPELRGALGVIPNLMCQIGIFSTYVAGGYLEWSALAFACKLVI